MSSRLPPAHVLLSLVGVLVSVGLGSGISLVGVVGGDILELRCLGVDDVCNLLNLLVNDLAVLDVDQRCQEHGADGNQRHAPSRDEVDEAV